MSHQAGNDGGWVVKFVPFSSTVDAPFWVQYCHEKLENIQLKEDPIPIQATFGLEGPPRLQCQESSLRIATIVPNERVAASGNLLGFNTLESFQNVDKNQILNDYFVPKFLKGDVSSLTSILLLTYPDLKQHKVLYWFGIPALLTKQNASIRAMQQTPLKEAWSTDECKRLTIQLHSWRRSLLTAGTGLPPFFARTKDKLVTLELNVFDFLGNVDLDEIVFGFFDPVGSTPLHPEQPVGWPMRNLVAFLAFHLDLGGKTINILSYRPKVVRRITSETLTIDDSEGESFLLRVGVPKKEDYEWTTIDDDDDDDGDDNNDDKVATSSKFKVVGWELNVRNKPGPRWVNLRPLLDSQHLAIQAADLNLKLMKWRMIPNLNVELLQSTKVLLIGAGTLGCSVARTLLGWGIRKFKILDYGTVSYSNPVRQNLFTLEDCHFADGSGRPKAIAAAEALKTIAADVESEGIVLSIPMPGHPETREAIEETVTTLESLMQECDVAFLLTDTRESRWLPTIMAAAHDKMLINAALGLDSWLVMRHGGGLGNDSAMLRLGCYFCNDIVAPENSTKNRTLDQQCTVTRPGLAPIASSMAAELMVSLLHHPKRHFASADRECDFS